MSSYSTDRNTNLFSISFTVGAESGLALVAAPDERSAIQVLRNSGRYNFSPEKYVVQQIRSLGLTQSCYFGLLMESFVNALKAYEALSSIANAIQGPKGDRGDIGPEGKKGDRGEMGPSGLNGRDGVDGVDGVSVSSVIQTITSVDDGGTNEVAITLDNGETSKVYFRNGRAGVTEAHATVDASQGTPGVVLYLENGVLSFAFTGLKGIQGNPGMNNTTMEVVQSLPQNPGSETTQKIYLVYNSETGDYDRYFTQFDGVNYSWVQAGSLSINLGDYQRKDDNVWLTQEEFDALAVKDITKVYNIYEESDQP